MLEPYEGKLSRTVLRGEGGSNTADLPDLAVIQQDTVAVIVVAALMHKAAGGSVLWVVHVGAFTVHFPAPFPVPAHGAIFCQDCFSRSAIPGRSLSSPGTRCKGRFSLW